MVPGRPNKPAWVAHRAITLALAMALGWPGTLDAQVGGRVTGPMDLPVDGALVELWGPTGRIAGTITDADGHFSFANADISAPLVLVVRRVGYAPARVRVTAAAVVVTMTPFVEARRAIVANAALCPRGEDPDARALWEAVARQYAPRSRAYWAAEARVSMARVRPDALGDVDTSTIGPGQIAAGQGYFEAQSGRIAQRGYATPFVGMRVPRFDRWEYPYLESLLAAHFIDSLFGALHTLSWYDAERTSLVFCPRDEQKPSIAGVLVIGIDTTLARARWHFVTPPPTEAAGGEVLFTAPAESAGPALLPAIGLFFRKTVFDYYQEWWDFRTWRTCHTDPDPRYCE